MTLILGVIIVGMAMACVARPTDSWPGVTVLVLALLLLLINVRDIIDVGDVDDEFDSVDVSLGIGLALTFVGAIVGFVGGALSATLSRDQTN